jgi:hypothetical protein
MCRAEEAEAEASVEEAEAEASVEPSVGHLRAMTRIGLSM